MISIDQKHLKKKNWLKLWKKLENGKAPGPTDLKGEILKVIDEEIMEILYNTGGIPK